MMNCISQSNTSNIYEFLLLPIIILMIFWGYKIFSKDIILWIINTCKMHAFENKISNSKFKDEWKNYLKINEDKSNIGVEYIRYIVLRMKFELSMIWSCFVSGINYYFISYSVEGFFDKPVAFFGSDIAWIKLLCILFMLLSFYLLFEAYSSVELLYKTRKLLVANTQEEAEVEKVKVEDITLKELTDLFK